MKDDIRHIEEELDRITAEVREKFGGVSNEQLFWRPDMYSWSIAQCFDHLIKTSTIYSKDFRALADGTHKASFMEKWSPLSGMFGRILIGAMENDEKKVKTGERFIPPAIVEENIVELFAESQDDLREVILSTAELNWQRTIITSSFMKFITYSLSDAYKIVIAHQRRHIRQAERLLAYRV